MATNPTPTPTKTIEQGLAHLDEVKNHVLSFKGKPGCNPFTWINRHIAPLVERAKSGEKDPELIAAMFAVSKPEKPEAEKHSLGY